MATTLDEERNFIERVTGHRLRSEDLLQTALIAFYHKRMALVGDAVLKVAILDDWYDDGTTIETGHKLQQKMAENATLQAWARQAGLGPLICLNAGQVPGSISSRQLSDAVEALTGAIWLDTGKDLDVIKQVIRTMDLASFASF
ncbi:hypothetical protein KC332_g10751 [Hortaea werneckii]|uniref:RNase III domain-containing protein n=2 Tax=Hortaea werneckii TaxID=91943 RepID=A0A3M7H9B4_HORWE|nr:hypothetical protein KC358_g10701 [Hortaea werneckii]OTA33877.1 hypothetical protein BTJ68_05753 [Hortaea werneckii EXF-2000]KAI6820904.1 hypothetical protein KC350_g9721 [Hortaea werneckii]KAI6919231.1 hypothetical protein KC348_g10664 [Hortaea werneckii]KAI6930078.1 hypothetical protein KC341_g10458 [Hortaea werneckii]